MTYFAVGLGDNRNLRRSRYFAEQIRSLLYSLVRANVRYLKLHPATPLLYQAGVRYREEEPTYIILPDGKRQRIERFDDIPTVLARGHGDCDDLGPWLCAQYIVRGKPARLSITWAPMRENPETRMFHVQVRRPWLRGTPPEFLQQIEDPSRVLGMGR